MATFFDVPKDVIKLILKELEECDKYEFVRVCSFFRLFSTKIDRLTWMVIPDNRRKRANDAYNRIKEGMVEPTLVGNFRMEVKIKCKSYCFECGLPDGVAHSVGDYCSAGFFRRNSNRTNCICGKDVKMADCPWFTFSYTKRNKFFKEFGFNCLCCKQPADCTVSPRGCLECKEFYCSNCTRSSCETCGAKYWTIDDSKDGHAQGSSLCRWEHVLRKTYKFEVTGNKSAKYFSNWENCVFCGKKVCSERWIITNDSSDFRKLMKYVCSSGAYSGHECDSKEERFLYLIDGTIEYDNSAPLRKQTFHVYTKKEFKDFCKFYSKID